MYFQPIPLLGLDDICRFWSYVDVLDQDDCWNWIGGRTGEGRNKRPCFRIGKHMFYGARVAWAIYHKKDPSNLIVCHTCRPKSSELPQLCVNPGHLWLGTHSENIIDGFTKGEFVSRGNTRLQDHDVLRIRELHASGIGPTRISEMYNTSAQNICKIVSKRTFAKVG